MTEDPANVHDRRRWPAVLPPVAQVLDRGLDPSLSRQDIPFHEMSHGESFLELAVDRFQGRGLRVLDEPESALSFAGCLSLLSVLKELLAEGNSQVIMSTHSPVLAALPGAQALEVGAWGDPAAGTGGP
ncbi:AAA family ATPase [Arthrobacter sp.]|uniref:AAA family ATPase n=1 Tax=Arthrobacter sp. TaxID=1667 RepID=UPI002810E2C6|nr:AAA family ATPase [Arthrobacter sp.]